MFGKKLGPHILLSGSVYVFYMAVQILAVVADSTYYSQQYDLFSFETAREVSSFHNFLSFLYSSLSSMHIENKKYIVAIPVYSFSNFESLSRVIKSNTHITPIY